jgi:hypothetical protein
MLRGWTFRVMFGITSAKAACLAGLLLGMPESPRWLAQAGRLRDARAAIAFLRNADHPGRNCSAMIDDELAGLEAGLGLLSPAPPPPPPAPAASSLAPPVQSLDTSGGSGSAVPVRRKPVWTDRATLRSILLCMGLQSFQQLSGVNAIIYFTPTILREVRVTALFEEWVPFLRGRDKECAMLATFLSYFPKLPVAPLPTPQPPPPCSSSPCPRSSAPTADPGLTGGGALRVEAVRGVREADAPGCRLAARGCRADAPRSHLPSAGLAAGRRPSGGAMGAARDAGHHFAFTFNK